MSDERVNPIPESSNTPSGSDKKAKKPKEPLKLVRINWLDAHGGVKQGWRSMTDLKKLDPAKAVSVGFLIKQTKSKVVVVPHVVGDSTTIDPDSEAFAGDAEIAIPAKWITEIIELGTL